MGSVTRAEATLDPAYLLHLSIELYNLKFFTTDVMYVILKVFKQ